MVSEKLVTTTGCAWHNALGTAAFIPIFSATESLNTEFTSITVINGVKRTSYYRMS